MALFFSVDRIESGFAVLQNDGGAEMILPERAFSFPLREGLVLIFSDGTFLPDEREMTARRGAAASLLQKILDKNKAGD